MSRFHKATRNDVNMVAKMMASSFAEYPFVDYFLRDAYKNENDRQRFLEKVSKILIKTLMRDGICFFEKNDSEVRAFCILSTIENMQPTVWDMVSSGALRLVPNLFNQATRQFIAFYLREAAVVNFQNDPNTWYVHLFAVSPNHQGKQLGSIMMNDCIFPYVKERQGNRILLSTNTEMALSFYKKNGFEQITHDEISYRGLTFEKWDLAKDLLLGEEIKP